MKNFFPYVRRWLLVSIMMLSGLAVTVRAENAKAFHSVDTAVATGNHSLINRLAAVSPQSKKAIRTMADENDRVITNVKVFYNPVAEQIAVSFKLSKLSHVTIKVMDALGNEVMNLHQGELDGGMQGLNFDTNNKLAPGFYFVRVTSGSEAVIKRISIR